MRTLLIACGNPLRGDDGAAAAAVKLLAPAPDRDVCAVRQLTPELAEPIARFDRVVFIDADAVSAQVAIEPVGAVTSRPALTHFSTPAEIVAISAALFGFTGEALLCRIPAYDFSASRILSAPALSNAALRCARQAAAELEKLI
jgi:Ni,Fe-hydrogenase maturation factor